MNTYTITLSSNSTSYSTTLSTQNVEDVTNVILNFENIYQEIIPTQIVIDWGNGNVQTIENDPYRVLLRTEVNVFSRFPITSTTQSQVLYPSETKLYKTFNIQVIVIYSDYNYSYFNIPVSLRSGDFFETIQDLKIQDVVILPEDNNPKNYIFKGSIDNQIFEMNNLDK
jgi:hypothetical protein